MINNFTLQSMEYKMEKTTVNSSWFPKRIMQQSPMDINPFGASVPEWMSGVCWVISALYPFGMVWKELDLGQGLLQLRSNLSNSVQNHLCLPSLYSQGPVADILWEEPFVPWKSLKATQKRAPASLVLSCGQCRHPAHLGMRVVPYQNGDVKAEEDGWCNFFPS